MTIETIKIVVNRAGYVKNEDEFSAHHEDAMRIVENYLTQMRSELDQAGYSASVEVKSQVGR